MDLLFSVLSHRRRRSVLQCLGEDPTSVEDLARLVAEDEGTASGRSSGAPRSLHVRTSLEHQHLPKLAHAGLVEWDRETETVARTPAAEAVDPLLGFVAGLGRAGGASGPDSGRDRGPSNA